MSSLTPLKTFSICSSSSVRSVMMSTRASRTCSRIHLASQTIVRLAKWIREHVKDARVLIITDRTELDEQIERVFKGVNEEIVRTKSGADLIAKLNDTNPWLLCSLIHKFGGKDGNDGYGDVSDYRED